jgi:spore coat polysaccharide biosynthesis predicted glycosyltransferase SpsG
VSAPRIVLFADGGVGIGLGHIFRVYPVFRLLRGMGVPAEMLVPLGEESLAQLRLEGVKPVQSDPEAMVAALGRSAQAVVVLDSYRHLPQLYGRLGERGCRLAIFDDHFCVKRKVALIVNSSPVVSASDYGADLASRFLFGPTHASLSQGFAESRARYVVSKDISRILVALGGTDACGNLPALLCSLLPLLQTPVEICVLSACPISVDIPDHVKLTWVWLDQDSLAQRMTDFDLAILAGGTMLLQTACVGIPTISWPQTPGQKEHAAAWESNGAVVAIKGLDALAAAVSRLQSPRLRLQLSRAGRSLVDGLGAGRIAACLCSMLQEE